MKGTVGLCNVGNTCYLNATIQCLRHCTDLSKFMISENYKEYLKDNDEKYLLTTWHELLYKLWSGSSTEPYNPTQFIRTFIRTYLILLVLTPFFPSFVKTYNSVSPKYNELSDLVSIISF